jgi:hypothetical protein
MPVCGNDTGLGGALDQSAAFFVIIRTQTLM